MTTKTNNTMIQELKDWYPKTAHIISGEEMEYITRVMELKERSTIDLKNLRDFTVLRLNLNLEGYRMKEDWEGCLKESDKLSAITAVIDNELFHRGEEV